MTTDVVIVDAVRTPSGRGKPGGALSGVHPVDLLAGTIQALLSRNDIDPALIDDVVGGCVTQSGEQAGNIARSAALAAGLPVSVPGTTLNRACGSSQQAVHFAAQAIIAGSYDVAIACGVESMSRVIMGSSTAGRDARGTLLAARFPDDQSNQGLSAELVAHRWKFDREALDEYSARSHVRAASTAASGGFANELVPVITTDADGNRRVVDADETIRASTTPDGLAGLRPSFRTDALVEAYPDLDWKITPGNSSPLTDAASAVLLMSAAKAAELGLRPRARLVSFAVIGDDPVLMLTAPIPATRMVLTRAGLNIDDIDAYEVNEAFAPVPLAWAQELAADPDKLNPRGGAIALGHAIGASGARLLTTLVNHLESTGGRYGLQTMCEFGGMANALIVERL